MSQVSGMFGWTLKRSSLRSVLTSFPNMAVVFWHPQCKSKMQFWRRIYLLQLTAFRTKNIQYEMPHTSVLFLWRIWRSTQNDVMKSDTKTDFVLNDSYIFIPQLKICEASWNTMCSCVKAICVNYEIITIEFIWYSFILFCAQFQR